MKKQMTKIFMMVIMTIIGILISLTCLIMPKSKETVNNIKNILEHIGFISNIQTQSYGENNYIYDILAENKLCPQLLTYNIKTIDNELKSINNIYADMRAISRQSVLFIANCDDVSSTCLIEGIITLKQEKGLKTNIKVLFTECNLSDTIEFKEFITDNLIYFKDVIAVVNIENIDTGTLIFYENNNMMSLYKDIIKKPVSFSAISLISSKSLGLEFNSSLFNTQEIQNISLFSIKASEYNNKQDEDVSSINKDILSYNFNMIYNMMKKLSSMTMSEFNVYSERTEGAYFSLSYKLFVNISYKAGIVLVVLAVCIYLIYLNKLYHIPIFETKKTITAITGIFLFFILTLLLLQITSLFTKQKPIWVILLIIIFTLSQMYLKKLADLTGKVLFFIICMGLLLAISVIGAFIYPEAAYLIYISAIAVLLIKLSTKYILKGIPGLVIGLLYGPYIYIYVNLVSNDFFSSLLFALFTLMLYLTSTPTIYKKDKADLKQKTINMIKTDARN